MDSDFHHVVLDQGLASLDPFFRVRKGLVKGSPREPDGEEGHGRVPEAQIPDRDFRAVPSLFINGNDDPFCGGNQGPLAEAVADGLTNCQWYHDALRQEIDNQSNSPHEFHNILGYGHVPTNRGGPANDVVDDFLGKVLATNPPPFVD